MIRQKFITVQGWLNHQINDNRTDFRCSSNFSEFRQWSKLMLQGNQIITEEDINCVVFRSIPLFYSKPGRICSKPISQDIYPRVYVHQEFGRKWTN